MAIQELLKEGNSPMNNPMSGNQDYSKVFLQRDFLPAGARRGQKVWILAQVGELGSKAEVTPISAQLAGVEVQGNSGQEEDSEPAAAAQAQGGSDY